MFQLSPKKLLILPCRRGFGAYKYIIYISKDASKFSISIKIYLTLYDLSAIQRCVSLITLSSAAVLQDFTPHGRLLQKEAQYRPDDGGSANAEGSQ
jgi:hypothetical protein